MNFPQEYLDFKYNNTAAIQYYEWAHSEVFSNLKIAPEDVVVDYGCGTGDLIAKYISPTAKRVYGVDISTQMIKSAQKNNERENITYIIGDFSTLKTRLELNGDFGKVDKFTGFFVINFFEDYGKFFTNVLDILKPGGLMGLAVPFSQGSRIIPELFKLDKWKMYAADKNVIDQASWTYNFKELDTTPFVKHLEAAGYTVTENIHKCIRIPFASLEQFAKTTFLWTPLYSLIPTDVQEDFLQDFKTYALSNMNELSLEVDERTGTMSSAFHVLIVIARRN